MPHVTYQAMQPATVSKTSSGEGMTARSIPRCIIWLSFTFLVFAIAIAITQVRSASAMMFWLVGLYGVQGLLAEVLGLKTDRTSLTIPRRLLPILPLLVFWRERIRWMDIADITSMSGEQRIQLRKRSGGRVQLTFRNRDQKLRFFEITKQMQPSISIYRTR
jgi:hypothetical protein